MSMCLFRVPASPNDSPHSAHLCTFSKVWVIMCLLNVPASPNDLLHSEQVWVFTPLWVSMCLFRCAAWPNALWHWTQAYSLSSVWMIRCFLKLLARPNDFLHFEQVWVLAPLWVSICLAKSLLYIIDLEHCLHWSLFAMLRWKLLTFNQYWWNWWSFYWLREMHYHFSFLMTCDFCDWPRKTKFIFNSTYIETHEKYREYIWQNICQ